MLEIPIRHSVLAPAQALISEKTANSCCKNILERKNPPKLS